MIPYIDVVIDGHRHRRERVPYSRDSAALFRALVELAKSQGCTDWYIWESSTPEIHFSTKPVTHYAHTPGYQAARALTWEEDSRINGVRMEFFHRTGLSIKGPCTGWVDLRGNRAKFRIREIHEIDGRRQEVSRIVFDTPESRSYARHVCLEWAREGYTRPVTHLAKSLFYGFIPTFSFEKPEEEA